VPARFDDDEYYDALIEHPITNGVVPHLLTVAGFFLAFFAIARLMSQRKQPGNTFAWLFLIAPLFIGAAPGAAQPLPFAPSQNTAYAAWFALHELLGRLAYRWSR